MELTAITALAPVDGRYARHTAALREHFSEFGLIRYRVLVELEWLKTLSREPAVPEVPPLSAGGLAALNAIGDDFGADDAAAVKDIERRTNHDVKAVEYFLKQRMAGHAELAPLREFVHVACTSEDINNLCHALMLRNARDAVAAPALDAVLATLADIAQRFASLPMLSRTHGQAATPTTLGKEFANVWQRLREQRARWLAVQPLGKMNGAVGNYNAHLAAWPDADWPSIGKAVVTALDLAHNPLTTQIEPHDWIAEYCHALMRINTVLIDLSRDLWSYISIGYFRQAAVAGEVGSSTMPHKVNPIDFENAEGNLGVANALLDHFAAKLPVSRWQRDLTDSTVLRNLGVALGHTQIALASFAKGLAKLEVDRDALSADLEDAWEVLAEPVQTVMRRYGVPEPYEKLKALTRGQRIDRAALHRFIEALDIPAEARERLLALTPATYLGNAASKAEAV
ncbi:MAG: adenylosuccinate lyase, partial [Pseudomonadota bacterium]